MGEMMLYGGVIGDRPRYGSDTWTYSLSTNIWTNISGTNTSPPRCFHSLAYDPINSKMIMVGGLSSSEYNWRADSWSYNYTSTEWEMGTRNAPSWRTGEQLAYDSDTQEIYLFGGYDGARFPDDPDLAKIFCGDTWRYAPGNDSWTLLSPTRACQQIAPLSDERANAGGTMIYDGRTKEIILFGPFAGSWYFPQTKTYAYNISTNTWTDKKATGAPDAEGGNNIMAYDSRAGEIVLFRSIGGTSNLYAFNSSQNVWTAKDSSNKPTVTFDDASMVFLE
jgi:N-acetylneuraminic acid mutarotase